MDDFRDQMKQLVARVQAQGPDAGDALGEAAVLAEAEWRKAEAGESLLPLEHLWPLARDLAQAVHLYGSVETLLQQANEAMVFLGILELPTPGGDSGPLN